MSMEACNSGENLHSQSPLCYVRLLCFVIFLKKKEERKKRKLIWILYNRQKLQTVC